MARVLLSHPPSLFLLRQNIDTSLLIYYLEEETERVFRPPFNETKFCMQGIYVCLSIHPPFSVLYSFTFKLYLDRYLYLSRYLCVYLYLSTYTHTHTNIYLYRYTFISIDFRYRYTNTYVIYLSIHLYTHFAAPSTTFVVDGSEWASLVELQGRGGAHGEARRDGQTRGGQARGDVAAGEELVGLQLGDGGPLGRVGVQHPLNERGGSRVDVLREEGGVTTG